MIFLICAIIGVIIAIVIETCNWGFDWMEALLTGMLGLLSGLILAVPLWLGLTCLPGAQPTTVSTETVEIHALVDNARYSSTVSGSVFLIQHRSDETLKYSYMYTEEGKGYAFAEVKAEQSYLNYTNDTPTVTHCRMDCKNPFLRWLLPDLYEDEYIFYIPYDAEVIDDFKIDFN